MFKAFSFLSLWSLSNNSSPAFEEHTKILLARKKGMKLQKRGRQKQFQVPNLQNPLVLGYSLELNLILQIKGPAAKLALKRRGRW